MLEPTNLVQVKGLCHGYDGVSLFDNINLSVAQDEFLTIVGPSGSGKSTLLRLLVGSELPRRGVITIGGQPKIKPTKQCGIVYQKYSVYPHLTVLENILFGLQAMSSLRPDVANSASFSERAAHYLEQMGLEDAQNKYPHQLSGGMEQRVAIAQALIVDPPVLLLDEPFSALDSWRREQLQLFLLDLYKRKKMTVIFVTHDLKEAVYLGTRVIVMSPPVISGATPANGSQIILDLPIEYPHPRPPQFKTSSELNEIVEKIRNVTAHNIPLDSAVRL